jgi:replicative superfamily II helicase
VPDSSRSSIAELARLVSKGVAFYNAALPKAARDLIEVGMKTGECRPEGRYRAEGHLQQCC